MTAQNKPRNRPFDVLLNGQTNNPMNDLQSTNAELDTEEEELAGRLEKLAERRAVTNQLIRKEKSEKRDELIRAAQESRDFAHKYRHDPDTALAYADRAKKAEQEAAQLAAELGIVEPINPAKSNPKQKPMLSSTKALGIVGGLFGASLIIVSILGYFVMKDPNNAMGQSMVMNSPLRVMIAFTLTFLTVLIGFLFLRLFFPQLYRIWHNRVDTERTFDSLLLEAPAGQVLLGILGLLALFMSVFAGYYQALYV